MKNTWMVIDEVRNGKRIAFAYQWHNCNNLIDLHERFPNAVSATICDTKKQAHETAHAWNETAKANGTYLFG